MSEQDRTGESTCEHCGKPMLYGRHIGNDVCIVVPEGAADAALSAAARVFGDRLYVLREDERTTTYALHGQRASKLQIVVPKTSA